MFGGIGYAELIVLAVVAVILFGKKLPEVARNVGQSYGQFRKGLSELQSSMADVKDDLTVENIEYESDDDHHHYDPGPKFEPPTDDASD